MGEAVKNYSKLNKEGVGIKFLKCNSWGGVEEILIDTLK